MQWIVERVAVRKIGKTAVFLSDGAGQSAILRLARSPIALARAIRNFDALQWLEAADLPKPIRGLTPRAIARGRHADYSYFVESGVDGRSGPSAATAGQPGQRWDPGAVRYITALHAASAVRERLDDPMLSRLIREPLARIVSVCDSPGAMRVLDRVRLACESALAGRDVPLVRTHGDFTTSNCLFDETGALVGVVDWEVSDERGLPLLDLLQLMPVPGEAQARSRWERFYAWLALHDTPEALHADPVFREYLQSMDLGLDVVPALMLMQWTLHVAERIEARCDDERWMNERVWAPLGALERVMP
jgi:aminoglycoside phosphotransferase (APT) family kinase protein